MTVIPEPREIRRLPRALFARPMSRGEALALEERFDSTVAPRLAVLEAASSIGAQVGTAMLALVPDVTRLMHALQPILDITLLADLRRSLVTDEFHARMLRGARGKAIRLERKRLNIRIRKQRRLLRELAQPSNGGPR